MMERLGTVLSVPNVIKLSLLVILRRALRAEGSPDLVKGFFVATLLRMTDFFLS